MKKLSRMLCALLLAACMCACSATAEELTGEAEGYGRPPEGCRDGHRR